MNRLEERYRRVLRVLPRSYRRLWEEDMVAAFLDSSRTGDADVDEYAADYGWPDWSEVVSVLALAVRLRLGGAGAPPRSSLWGQAVRLAVLTTLLTSAVSATAELLILAWLSGGIGWLPQPRTDWVLAAPLSRWPTTWLLLGAAWAAPFVALVLGQPRVAQALALLAMTAGVISAVVELAAGAPWRVYPWVGLLLGLLLVAAMTAFHADAPPIARRPWLLALGIGVVIAVPALLLIQQASRIAPGYALDPADLSCILVTVATVVHLTRHARRGGRHPDRPDWTLALALLAAAALAQRVLTLTDVVGMPNPGIRVTMNLLLAAAVAAVGIALARRGARHLRHLPGPDAPRAPTAATSTRGRPRRG